MAIKHNKLTNFMYTYHIFHSPVYKKKRGLNDITDNKI